MIAALALVLACIYGCVFLIKRFGVNRAGLSRDKRMLEVIDSISVGPKKMIAVVRVGERAVVVGITESGMTSLTELDKEELPETVKSTGAAQHAHRPSFSGLLDSMMNRSRSEARSAESNAGTVAP
jgi:flagellar protein FliO/FliZ